MPVCKGEGERQKQRRGIERERETETEDESSQEKSQTLNREHFKSRPPLFLQKINLAPSWQSRQGQTEASRLTTFFEIRDSRWEITETGGQAKDCLSGPAASHQALLHLLCQNCPSLHPRGRLMQDESSVCSMRFQHAVLSSNPCSKNMAVTQKTLESLLHVRR